MFSQFKDQEKLRKQAVITQMNADLNASLNQLYGENYQQFRSQLLMNGVTEAEVDKVLEEIKSSVQREMVQMASRQFKEKLQDVVKKRKSPQSDTMQPSSEPTEKHPKTEKSLLAETLPSQKSANESEQVAATSTTLTSSK